MDFTMKQWIVGSILFVIVVIVIDGVRRMRNARRDSLHMSLKVKSDNGLDVEDENYGSEFPNGGARVSQQTIDKQRIDKVRSQYDYGRDLSSIIAKKSDPKIASKSEPFSNSAPERQSQYGTSFEEGHVEEYVEESTREYQPESHTDLHRTENTAGANAEINTEANKENISTDQWVDSDEQDEEYYAEKWDDDLGDDTFDNGADSVVLGDGNLESDDHNHGQSHRSKDIQNYAQHNNLDENALEAREEPLDFSDDSIENQGVETQYLEEHEEDEPALSLSEERLDQQSVYQQPEQVPLNLEESVPVLMESVVEETVVEEAEADVQIKTAHAKPKSKEKKSANIRSVAKHIKPSAESTEQSEDHLDTHSANKPRYESKYFSKKASVAPEKVSVSTIQEVLVVNVKAPKGGLFHGSDLLQQVLDNGLRYGAMEVFHRHADEDGEGPVIFSMANMLKPGTFDLKTIDEFTTAGVTLFLTLPVFNDNNMAAFDLMIATAKSLAENLGGELNDENRSIMTGQTIEHYRERIRDFSRRQQLEKKR